MEKLNKVAVVMTAATGAFAVLTVVGPAVKSKDKKTVLCEDIRCARRVGSEVLK